ncbi:MAG: hypothetical protein ABIO70_21665 [Pseudomonadota bacterium]
MSLPAVLPLHPADVFFGVCVPQVQTYLCALPGAGLQRDGLGPRLATLIDERFPRLAYRMPATLGVVSTLRLDPAPATPLELLPLTDLEALDVPVLARSPGERHWHLYVGHDGDLCLLLLVFDHLLCHGHTGRAFLYAAADLLRPDASAPPALTAAQRARFEAFQQHLTAGFHALAPWADYRRLAFPAADLQRLAKSLGQPFTEAAALWIGRSLLDVSHRGWPLDISIFRMDREADPATFVDLAVGNRGLQLDAWELMLGGAYARAPAPVGDDPAGLTKFVNFYERFPWKWPLAWGMKAAITGARRGGLKDERERLVLNNLGATPWPFFRTMFFDPANDVDRFGLVFVDGVEDRVELQLAPPNRFLEHFDIEAFEARLAENLTAMVGEPRVRALEG